MPKNFTQQHVTLWVHFCTTGVQTLLVLLKMDRLAKIGRQLMQPSECIALAKFLLEQRKKKNNPRVIADADEAFCFEILNRVSRSFAAVIEGLPPTLRKQVCVFYLVLRALDTVEDDMTIEDEKKKTMLRDFANHLRRPAEDVLPIVSGYGDTDDYRELLRRYDQVIRVFQGLGSEAQNIIEEITVKMQNGMADFVGATRVTSHADYELYCHYVAGLVGIGLSKLWAVSPEEGAKWSTLPNRDKLSNEMGLFLQKTNITRDYREDIEVNRLFWPKEIWSKYASTAEEFMPKENAGKGVEALNHMVTDALKHIPSCIEYLELLSDPAVFKFCAIPQVMAIATLNELYDNPKVLQTEVKIRKGKAVLLMQGATDMTAVKRIFHAELLALKAKIRPQDRSAQTTMALVEKALAITHTGALTTSSSLSKLLSTAMDVSLLATFATGVHRLSVCSQTESCNLLDGDGLGLLAASVTAHVIRVVKHNTWLGNILGNAQTVKLADECSKKRCCSRPISDAMSKHNLPDLGAAASK